MITSPEQKIHLKQHRQHLLRNSRRQPGNPAPSVPMPKPMIRERIHQNTGTSQLTQNLRTDTHTPHSERPPTPFASTQPILPDTFPQPRLRELLHQNRIQRQRRTKQTTRHSIPLTHLPTEHPVLLIQKTRCLNPSHLIKLPSILNRGPQHPHQKHRTPHYPQTNTPPTPIQNPTTKRTSHTPY